MSCKLNHIVIGTVSSQNRGLLKKYLKRLEPALDELIGKDRIASVQNYKTCNMNDVCYSVFLNKWDGALGDDELLFIYPRDLSGTSVMVDLGPEYWQICFALTQKNDKRFSVEILHKLWSAIGEQPTHLVLALVGEEMEISDIDIKRIVKGQLVLKDLDLLDIAIVNTAVCPIIEMLPNSEEFSEGIWISSREQIQ